MDTFKLEIVTPNGLIYQDDAIGVTLPGQEGEFGVKANHSSLSTLLDAGVVDIERTNNNVESVLINWGVVNVDEEKVVVLVEGAVAIRGESESDVARALDEAKELVKSIEDSGAAIATVSAKLENAAQKLV